MPYAANVYSLPPGTAATTLTPVDSSDYNSFISDIEAAQNAARPVVAGGTGGNSVITGWDGLAAKGTDIADGATINLTTATGPSITMLGTTTLTGVTLAEGSIRLVRAAAAKTITASANLLCNGSSTVNMSVAAEDLLVFRGGAGGVVSVAKIGGSSFATPAQTVAGTSTTLAVNPLDVDAARLRRNRIVNPAMQVSQENINASATTDAYYFADEWRVDRVTSAGTITVQRVQSVTPKGAKDRGRVTITVADASLAAGEFLKFRTVIEGQEAADFQYGGASAKQSVLRFLFKGPAGTYAVALRNSAANRSYVATFSPAVANTEEVISLVIPGDATGTWLTDTGIGIELNIVLACGSTFQGTTGWQAGSILGTSGVSNGMGTGAAVFEVGEAGLYLDPNSTGVAPAWELPQFSDELRRCIRYWEKTYNQSVAIGAVTEAGVFYIASNAANVAFLATRFKEPKRAAPTITFYNPATGSSGSWRFGGSDVTPSSADIGENGFTASIGTIADGALARGHFTANARL